MTRLVRFFRKPRADRRLLLLTAAVHPFVSLVLHLLPFSRVQRLLARLAACGPRPAPIARIETRAADAVRTIASLMPGEHCLADALVGQWILARHGIETTVCFGIARGPAGGGSFDAHAWLEHNRVTILGARAIAYDPLASPSRCAPSSSSR